MTQRVSSEQIYQQVNDAIATAIAQQGSGVTGVGRAVVVANSQPITTFYDLIKSFPKLTPEMIEKAASAFQDTTGIDPVSLSVSDTGSTIKRVGKKIVNYNAFYMFFPIGLVLFIGIWLMMAFGWFDWAVAIYLSMLLIIILYVCDVLYRINAQDAIDKAVDEDLPTSSSDSLSSQQNMKTFIAYIPQLVHAIGSAISST